MALFVSANLSDRFFTLDNLLNHDPFLVLADYAAYLDAQWFATPWLVVYAGARYDRFTTSGRIRQDTPPTFLQDYPDRSEGQLSPKVAAVASGLR